MEVINPARSLSRHPLFQVMLVLQNNAPVDLEGLPGGLTAVPGAGRYRQRQVRSVDQPGGAARRGWPCRRGSSGYLEYATDLFDRSSVEALAERFVRLLEAAVAEPDRAIGRLDILIGGGAHTLLREWNDTARRDPVGDAAGAVRGTGRADAPTRSRWCTGRRA